MRDVTTFLERLGLPADAGERDIRRAYGQQLKLIDQELSPAAFQELREAYEAAMQWVKNRDKTEVGPPQPLPPMAAHPQAQAALLANDQQLAAAVFAHFTEAAVPLTRQTNSDVFRWTLLLEDCLEDERLLNLSARTIFEQHIVQLLASARQPGYRGLLVAADRLFRWGEDSQRLRQLGQAGMLVEHALAHHMLATAPKKSRSTGQKIVQRLRQHWMYLVFMAILFAAAFATAQLGLERRNAQQAEQQATRKLSP